MAKPKKDEPKGEKKVVAPKIKKEKGATGVTGVSTEILPQTKKVEAKVTEPAQETNSSLNKEEFPQKEALEKGIAKYMEKHSTNSITGHYLNELGVTSEHTAGITSMIFGKYSLKRTHATTDLWAIEDNSPSED